MDSEIQAFEKKPAEPREPEAGSVQRWLRPGQVVMAMAGALERLEPLVAKRYAASQSQLGSINSVTVQARMSMDSKAQDFAERPEEPGGGAVDSVQPWPGSG